MKNSNKILRSAFIFPLLATLSLLILYLVFFFEIHLKWIAERTLFESLGTEVNISEIKIRPFKEFIEVNKIQFTDPDKPTQNIFEIEKIYIPYKTKKLLDMSFQSEEVKISNISFHTKRKRAGRVLSKDKRVLVLKDPSTHKISSHLKNSFDENSFLRLTRSLKGDLSSAEVKEFSQKFDSMKLYEELAAENKEIKSNISSLKEKLDSEEIKSLVNEIKDFKFDSSSSENTLKSTAKSSKLIKKIEETKKDLKKQLNAIEDQIKASSKRAKAAPNQIASDLKIIKSDYSRLDPAVISEELFGTYFALQVSKISRVKSSMTDSAYNQIEKKSSVNVKDYLKEEPTELKNINTNTADNTENQLSRTKLEEERQALISKKGRWFNFKKKPEPKYWIKKIDISSKASKGQDLGDVNGSVMHLTSDPEITKLPMQIDLVGSAPKQDIGSFSINGTIDKTKLQPDSEEFKVKVADYKVKDFEVLKENDAFLNFKESQAETLLSFKQQNGKISLNLEQILRPTTADYEADNKIARKILEEVSKLSPLNLKLEASGEISKPKIKISTNIAKKILDSVKSMGSDLVKQKISDEIEKAKKDFLKNYLPKVSDNESSLLSESSSLDKQVEQLFDKEISKLKSEAKSKKNEKIDKLKDKLLKKIKF